MPVVVGIKFGNSSKIYYFDPKDTECRVGDNVIVETVRGLEYAQVGMANTQVADSEVKSPLKPIVRKATPDDDKRAAENLQRRDKAYALCQKKIEKHGLKMKLVDAEYTFDRSKVIFSFTADGRVDFRDLVKDLAGEMRMRIELRQIYERDDIKLRGAMGMCGRECCCIRFLRENEKATVKMAKNQNISLNPAKVSGMCGKLMCCLRYENEYYAQMGKFMPKVRSMVRTEDGIGKVTEVDVLRERVKVAIEKDDGVMQQYYGAGEYEPLGKPGGKSDRQPAEQEPADDGADFVPQGDGDGADA